MSFKRYEYKCLRCDHIFESPDMRDALCPLCEKTAVRVYSSASLFRPTATKNIGKARKGTQG